MAVVVSSSVSHQNEVSELRSDVVHFAKGHRNELEVVVVIVVMVVVMVVVMIVVIVVVK